MVERTPAGTVEEAVLGGGCFWCTEAVFSELAGVREVEPGYAGGTVPHPSYEEVCDGGTGHAEVIRVRFDPQVVTYDDLLRIFLTVHDPTTLDRQGADVGPQYRSIILTTGPEQRAVAERVIKEIDAAHLWHRPIVTRVEPLTEFYPAEEYHRDYFRRNPGQGYCRLVIAPKVAKFRKQFQGRLARATA
ncbi:MAG TPA: peptide-methionine (S)-S-oxide reductase MsrA [Thermoplasmata archaeon]|nr:peptide-methionine (S)-S-oxide reductase MsrA [Thermoplasmata archaeon]